jgi:hypothetical protein
MRYLNKLPGSRREPPGLEWTLLRRLPLALLGGTLIPALAALGSHLRPPRDPFVDIDKHLQMIDFMAIATVVTVWVAILTIAIGCCVVVIMKGPAYVADRYDLSDADDPDGQ